MYEPNNLPAKGGSGGHTYATKTSGQRFRRAQAVRALQQAQLQLRYLREPWRAQP
jgi:hypothetical protein